MKLSDYQLGLLEFIASLTVVPRVYFEPGAGHDLKRLKALGLVCYRRLAGKSTLWQATVKGCHLIGAPESRARRLGGQALHQKIVVGYLVTALGYRLLSREQPLAPPSVCVVLSPDSKVLRVLTPGPFTDPRAVARSIRRMEETNSKLAFNEKERGYLVTATSALRKKALSASFKRAALYGQKFALRIEIVPSPLELSRVANETSD